MNEIENLGLALNVTRELLNHLKCFISEARDNQRRVESVRGMARRVDDYWQPIDAQNFLAWKKVYVKTKFLIHTCDEYNRQQELEMIKMKSASEAASSSKAKATSQSRDKASEVIDI